MRISDIADASDAVTQDFDRSDISIQEAEPALRRTARVSKVLRGLMIFFCIVR